MYLVCVCLFEVKNLLMFESYECDTLVVCSAQ